MTKLQLNYIYFLVLKLSILSILAFEWHERIRPEIEAQNYCTRKHGQSCISTIRDHVPLIFVIILNILLTIFIYII